MHNVFDPKREKFSVLTIWRFVYVEIFKKEFGFYRTENAVCQQVRHPLGDDYGGWCRIGYEAKYRCFG